MRGRRIKEIIIQHKTAIVFTIIGLIAGPIVGAMINVYITITPKRLAGLLEDDKVSVLEQVFNVTKDSKSKAKVLEFNELRKNYKQPITLENVDLSNKTLTGVNLGSIIILHSNLSGANLERSILDDAQISGDLSDIKLRSASMYNADLMGSNLSNAILKDAFLSEAELIDTLFPGANLANADLSYADLTNADFHHADVTDANVYNSRLTNVTLKLTDLGDSSFDCNKSTKPSYWYFVLPILKLIQVKFILLIQ